MARITVAYLQTQLALLSAENDTLRTRLAEQAQCAQPAEATESSQAQPSEACANNELAEYAALHCGVGHLPRKSKEPKVTYFTNRFGERFQRTQYGNRAVLRPCA